MATNLEVLEPAPSAATVASAAPAAPTALAEPASSVTSRVVFAALGGLLVGAGSRDRESAGLYRLAGLALIGVAARPIVAMLVRNAGQRRRTVSIRGAIEIARSVEDVFAFVKDFENLPLVVRSLRSVVDYQDGRSLWEAYSPSGEILEWSSVVTKFVPNAVIAWESVAGSPVEARGAIRFAPLGPARMRLEVEASYRPEQTEFRDAIRAFATASLQDRVMKDMEHARFYLESFRGGLTSR